MVVMLCVKWLLLSEGLDDTVQQIYVYPAFDHTFEILTKLCRLFELKQHCFWHVQFSKSSASSSAIISLTEE